MPTITMTLAAASEQDMDTALHIGGILNDLDDCNSAYRHCSIRTLESIDNPDAEEEPKNDLEDFDPENETHCKLFVERLLKLLDRSPGCLNRVLWGFSTVRSNNVLDLESDHLALHPDLIAKQQKAAKYDADVAELNQRLIDRTTGMQEVIQAQQLEIARLKSKLQETITHLRSSTNEGSDTWCLAEELAQLQVSPSPSPQVS